MNAVTLSDAQIDAQASRYALTHRVSYAEALAAVASNFSESSRSADVVAFMRDNRSSESDKALHAKAMTYSAENRVSYAEALSAVAVSFAEAPAGQAAAQGGGDDDQSDSRLHYEAMAYHLQHKVPYAEALKVMAERRTARLSADSAEKPADGGLTADQQLHARAVAYSESQQVSYVDALAAVANGATGGA